MIFVCEPQCRGSSHEKVNSGFLTVLRAAYATEPIRFYCHPTHGQAVRTVLAHDRIDVTGLELRDFPVEDTYAVSGVITYLRAFTRLFRDARRGGGERILFLSGNPILYHAVKRVHARPEFRALRIAFVLHADFEDVAKQHFSEPIPPTTLGQRSLWDKLRSAKLIDLPKQTYASLRRQAHERYASLWKARVRERDQLLWHHSTAYRYIALSPHVVRNAAQHLDVTELGIRSFHMPINFAPVRDAPRNVHIKLASFGFGDVAALRRLALAVAARRPSAPYEIRVIGMDTRGLDGLPGVTLPSGGRLLPRAEMELLAEDIDAFLILYDRSRYNLSCSGSIFEAFSYLKPVLHLGNACVAEFDPPDAPIGFAHDSIETLAATVVDMIEHPERWREALAMRRENLLRLRERLSIEALAPALRDILSFS